MMAVIQGGGKQCEQRKRTEVNLAGLDRVKVPEPLQLGVEDGVGVDSPFGGTGTAAGKEDGGRIIPGA